MADGNLQIAVNLIAIDKMTETIRKASTKGAAGLKAFSDKTAKISEDAAKIGRDTAIMGAAIAAPLVYATKKAIDFESAMADVAKVANVDKGSAQFRALSNDALQLSKYLATGAEDVGKLYSNLIAGGTKQGELAFVAKTAGEAAVAFDMTQEAAGNAFATMRNAMGLTTQQTKAAFDATNALSNAFGGKASELLDFMSSGGASVARTLKATAPEMQAFGRAMTMSGLSAEEAGTVMRRFQAGLYGNAEAMKIFTNAGGGATGMSAVFAAAQASGDAFKWFDAHKFGEKSASMALLAKNSDKLGEMLKFMGDQSNYAGSASKEFAARMDTTEMRLKQARASLDAASIKIGNAFIPVLTKLINKVTPLIERLSKWIEKNPVLTKNIVIVTAALAAMLLVVSAASFAVSGVTKAVSLATLANANYNKAILWLTSSTAYNTVISKASAAGTWLMTAAQTAAATASTALGWAVRGMSVAIMNIPIIGWILAIIAAIIALIANWKAVKNAVVGAVKSIGEVLTKFVPRMVEFGKNIISGLWEGIKSMITKPIETITNLGTTIKNKFKSILGIASPSKLFLEYGKNITIGAALGITSGLPSAANATKALTNTIIQTPQTNSRLKAAPGRGASINYAPVITINGASPTVKEDLNKILEQHSKKIYQIVKQQEAKNARQIL